MEKVQNARIAAWIGKGAPKPAAFVAPVPNTLDDWLRSGAAKIGFDPVEWKNGKPPQKKGKTAKSSKCQNREIRVFHNICSINR